MPLLFSYGTLQLEKVQKETFNRILKGFDDQLKGYKLENLQIVDVEVLQKSEQSIHPIAVRKNGHFIVGKVFEISESELALCDSYEVENYKRVKLKLESGKSAWVYVEAI